MTGSTHTPHFVGIPLSSSAATPTMLRLDPAPLPRPPLRPDGRYCDRWGLVGDRLSIVGNCPPAGERDSTGHNCRPCWRKARPLLPGVASLPLLPEDGRRNGYGRPEGMRPVRCVETGEVFESSRAAAAWAETQVRYVNLSARDRRAGRNRKAGGYNWEIVEPDPLDDPDLVSLDSGEVQ